MRILSIDPGDRTGISIIQTYGQREVVTVERAEVVLAPAFPKWLIKYHNSFSQNSFDAIVVENWINYSGLDANTVLKIIGNVELWAMQREIPLVVRSPQSRELARGVFKFKKPSHDPDHLSATLHGLSYLLHTNIISPKWQLDFTGNSDLTNYLKS